MRYLSTAGSDVLNAIRGLQLEAREFRQRAEAASSVEEKCVLTHRADKLEEMAAYLRAHLP